MGMIKTAAQILSGRLRPIDMPFGNKSHPGLAGRKRQYPNHCQNCQAVPHHSKGLCKPCYRRWDANPDGPIQPFEPTWPENGNKVRT